MYRIGIDLGGTFIAAGLVDESLRILDKLSVPTNAPRSMAGIADDMAALAGKLLERSGLRREELAAVGVGVPGTANRENGHLEDANNLGFDDEPFVSVLEERLGLPVRFGNDANAAAWGVQGGRGPGGLLRDDDHRHRHRRRGHSEREALGRRQRRGGGVRPHDHPV